MDSVQVIIIFASIVGVAGLGAIGYVFLGSPSGRGSEIRGLMEAGKRGEYDDDIDAELLTVEEIKRRSGRAQVKTGKEDITQKLFRAGLYTAADKQTFRRKQLIAPIISTAATGGIMWQLFGNPALVSAAVVLGIFIGFAWPMSWLEREIRRREEETMYYLPLVIEQVSIGVSSSLDVGPCLSHIVEMASERDSHNPVTEMFVHVEKLIRSGLSLEDALIEVGEANGQTEVKHAFMFLSQCAKHGGEVSKQLQELADSVMVQRQVQVEGRITALPVKATGPLATVFAGFFALLFAGLLVRLMSAFGA